MMHKNGQNLVCTTSEKKSDVYASVHIWVIEEEFTFIHKAGVFPTGT
jgi:hypothetical protein